MSLLPYARLLRIPNVFTALADISLGFCIGISFQSTVIDASFLGRAALLFLASGCLYCAGMVWNDYFDIEEDTKDRPFRPLPSKAISLGRARTIAIALTVIGWIAAACSGTGLRVQQPDGSSGYNSLAIWEAAFIAGGLVLAILAYDRWLKRTRIGPLGMGLCRALNVYLGLTLVPRDLLPELARLHVAGTVGLYIVGVTWFARTEAHVSKAAELRSAASVMMLALFSALAVPMNVQPDTASPLYPYLLVAFAFAIGFPVMAAINQPTPRHVQAAVKRCILGLIALDAILATAFIGTPGLLILLLLPPGLLIGKWVYST